MKSRLFMLGLRTFLWIFPRIPKQTARPQFKASFTLNLPAFAEGNLDGLPTTQIHTQKAVLGHLPAVCSRATTSLAILVFVFQKSSEFGSPDFSENHYFLSCFRNFKPSILENHSPDPEAHLPIDESPWENVFFKIRETQNKQIKKH